MRIFVDGAEREVADGMTVAELLAAEGEPADGVLIQVNRAYVPAAEYARRQLDEGDRVEIVQPAFGG